MKKILSALLLLGIAAVSNAQNFDYGSINPSEIQLNKYASDTSANAVVLREYGNSFIQLDANNRLNLYHIYHVRIKILNKKGYDQANIVIPLRKSGDKEEIITELKASTFHVKNGQKIETPLEKSKIFTENKSKYTTLTKFTLPNLQEGCIIEYTYKIQSPFYFNFRTWEFQTDIPKIYSEYEALIPAIYTYNVILRGPLKLNDSKALLEREGLILAGVKIDCSKMTYIMRDIPAFIEEEHMTAPSNFKSAIYFELSESQDLNGAKIKYTKEWRDVDHELVTSKDLGGQMKRKDLFKDISSVIKDAGDDLSKARTIFEHIKKTIKWDQYLGIFADAGVKTALEKRSGNTAEINLALIAALSAAGLDAEAVILSTRQNGVVNKIHPVITDFNYLVAKVNIGDTYYLLDATDPLQPFGLLPEYCLNDEGRVINLKKPSYWISLMPKQKRMTNYSFDAHLTPEGKLKGIMTIYSYDYAALNKRRAIKKYNTVEEYVEKLDENMSRMHIQSHDFINLDNPNEPLTEKYEMVIDVFDNTEADRMFFNPFWISRIAKNPFNLNERTYPVDLATASDERIIVNISLPEKFSVSETPTNTSLTLPNNGGKFIASSVFENNTFSFSQVFQLNKPIYQPNEYLSLKEFYSRIIQLQKTDVIFKRTGK